MQHNVVFCFQEIDQDTGELERLRLEFGSTRKKIEDKVWIQIVLL